MQSLRSLVDRALEWVLITLVAVMTLNVLWQVFTRFILRNPSSYTEELARYLLVWLGLLGASYAGGKKLHLAIDLLPMQLKGRSKTLLEVLIQACVFVFACLVMLMGGIDLVNLTLSLEQSSAALRVKLGYVYLALPLSGALLMFYATAAIIDHLRRLKELS